MVSVVQRIKRNQGGCPGAAITTAVRDTISLTMKCRKIATCTSKGITKGVLLGIPSWGNGTSFPVSLVRVSFCLEQVSLIGTTTTDRVPRNCSTNKSVGVKTDKMGPQLTQLLQ